MIKYIFGLIVSLFISCVMGYSLVDAGQLPNPTSDFFNYMKKSDKASGSSVYDPASFGIDSTKSLKDNVRMMFYPTTISGGNKLWPIMQTITQIIFFIFIIVIGYSFLMEADDNAKITNAKNSFMYLMYGGFLVFGSMWILKSINVEFSQGGADLVLAVKDKVIFNMMSFIKASAFFIAIVLIMYHGLQIIRAYEKEDKMTEARKAIVNILAVLILIKVIDYVYVIAYDGGFKTKAVEFIIEVSKLLGWSVGVIAVIYLIYAGYMLVIGQGESDRLKKSTNIIKGIFFAVLIIFLFLLTTYQLFKDLG